MGAPKSEVEFEASIDRSPETDAKSADVCCVGDLEGFNATGEICVMMVLYYSQCCGSVARIRILGSRSLSV